MANESPLKLEGDFCNQLWRISNLYWIVDDEGKKLPFRPNEAQLELLDDLWYLNAVLKSRQHGFTTLICILGLDQAVFEDNQTVGVIAHGLRETQKIFKSKIKFPYESMPGQIREAVYPTADSTTTLSLSNGSSIEVATSIRSGTAQFLLVSEFGKISRRYPDKAKEIVTGSLNAVHTNARVFVESTAEGRDGYYYKICMDALKRQQADKKLTVLDFRLHFFPWWQDPKNTLDPKGVAIPPAMKKYFEELLDDHEIKLSAGQKAWYTKKSELQGENMKSEHPSYPEEAFKSAVEGAIYGKQMEWLRAHKRIRQVDLLPNVPTNFFWDLGHSDATSIWAHQFVAGEHRFPWYYENRLEEMAHYVKEIDKLDYTLGMHYLPHDGDTKRVAYNSAKVRLNELGVPKKKIEIVPRISDVSIGIEMARKLMPQCYFGEEGAADGVKALDNYMYEWDEKMGCFKSGPLHNWASNGSDAWRQFAQHWTPTIDKGRPRVAPHEFLDQEVGF